MLLGHMLKVIVILRQWQTLIIMLTFSSLLKDFRILDLDLWSTTAAV